MQTATNPQTGETVVLIGNEWKPATQTAKNKDGVSAYLVGGDWVVDDKPSSLVDRAIGGVKDTAKRVAQGVGNFAAGNVRGAASIGATLMRPFESGDENKERRQKVDDFLKSLGAEPDSVAYGAWKIGTEIAGTAGAGPALAGVARGVGMASVAPRVVNAIQSAGMTTGATVAPGMVNALVDMVPRVVGGSLVGAGSAGAIDPSSAGTGAMIGGALPPALKIIGGVGGKVGQVVQAAAEPFSDVGRQRIIGRLYNRVAGADAPAARAALASAGEIVPGSLPTAGQAAGNAGIAALERTSSAIEPSATQAFANRFASQNQARVNALEGVAGEPGKKALFEADRATAAQQLYDEAYQKGMDLRRNATTGTFLSKAEMAGRKGEINNLLKRPAIQSAIEDARKLAANEGVNMTDMAGSVKGLDYVQRALNDQISKATGNEQRVLINLRDRLLTTIDTLSPRFAEARVTFREMSKPINQMDIGEEIANKSINKLTGNIQPNAFARAVSDDTARRATGFKGSTLENTLEPAQIETLNKIKDDLARAAFAQNAGRGVGSDTVQKLAYSNFIDATGIPTWLRNLGPAQTAGNIVSRGADALYGRANRELAAKLAESGLEPKVVAEMMKVANQSGLSNALSRLTGAARQNAIQQLLTNPSLAQLPYRSAPALAANR